MWICCDGSVLCIFCLCMFLSYWFAIFFILNFLLEIQLVGVIVILLSNVFDCDDFSIIMSLVQEYVEESVDSGKECCVFVLCRVIWSILYDSYCGGGFSVYIESVSVVCFLKVRSRKFILFLTSASKVKFNFGMLWFCLTIIYLYIYKILKTLLTTSILATCPVHFNVIDLITLTILGEQYNIKCLILKPFPLPILIFLSSNIHCT